MKLSTTNPTDFHGSEIKNIPSVSIRSIRGSKNSGAALLIALAFLVLLSAVVLALFSSATTGRRNATTFATGQETLRLADAAVNLVQGQIRDATIQPRVGWASQPGMVRGFDTSGNATAYKLYSSDAMVVPGYGETQMDAEFSEISTWNSGAPANSSFNALYADLNAPAVVKRPDPANPTQSIDTPVFPIADPAAIGAVEGFSATTAVAGTTLSSDATRRLPMPVKWIYVLKDGQMTSPSGGTATKATFSGVVPTQANPIVGRIAFWADDDTSKLNINTASEGTFWDVPKGNTQSEARLGVSMPVRGEFQRLAGHPATTCLSPALEDSINNPGTKLLPRAQDIFLATNSGYISKVTTTGSTTEPYYVDLTKYLSLTPKVHFSDRSSMAGLYRISQVTRMDTSSIWPEGGGTAVLPAQGQPISFDSDRLYATPDELLFAPNRSNNTGLSASELSKRDFFLTAQSRAPETTLFGTPRISLWPQQFDAANERNTIDRLIAFCSRVGGADYFFQRDIARGIQESTPPADQTGHDASLPRNTQIFDYVRNLGKAPIPGFGGNFQSKWGATGIDKVLAQTFDISRANINEQVAQGTDKKYSYSVYQTDALIDWAFSGGPQRYVVPAKISANARGSGRFMTFSQAALVFFATDITNFYKDASVAGTTYSSIEERVTMNEPTDGKVTPVRTYVSVPAGLTSMSGAANTVRPHRQKTNKFRAILVLQPFYTNPGNPLHYPGASVKISGLNSFQVGLGGSWNSANFYGDETKFGTRQQNNTSVSTDKCFGNLQYLFTYLAPGQNSRDQRKIKFPGSDPLTEYAFITTEFSPPDGESTFDFVGGDLKIEVSGYKSGDLIQTINLNFPNASGLPIPQHVRNDKFNSDEGLFDRGCATTRTVFDSVTVKDTAGADHLSVMVRMRLQSDDGAGFDENFIRPGDVVLGVQLDPNGPTKGDFRLLALEENVPKSWFSTHPDYNAAKAPFIVDPSTSNLTNLDAAIAGRHAHALRNDGSANGVYAGDTSSYKQTFAVGWLRNIAGTAFAQRQSVDAIRPRSSLSNPDLDTSPRQGTLHKDITYTMYGSPIVPFGTREALNAKGKPGDWSSGSGNDKDGAFFIRFDPGNSDAPLAGYFGSSAQAVDYRINSTVFEPNKYVPSAGVLAGIVTPDNTGSLQPWQTLLACPFPASGNSTSSHAGFASPPDHLYMDNFWMPVSEPYPISEPLSTAGKVNLNAQLAPFTHIERTTSLRGAIKPLLLGAVPNNGPSNSFYENYKCGVPGWGGSVRIRHEIDPDQTIKALLQKLDAGDFYRSASEVSTIPLIPVGSSVASIGTWWDGYKPTSDTLREQPYTALLSRVTTKSNTFTVHYRVQALKQPPRPNRDWAEWDEASDQITGEYRGSTTIERFLDPNAENIPDYTQVSLTGNYQPIDTFYRWRVLSQKQFAP